MIRANKNMLNVLIIDDDSDIRFGVSRIVSRLGHSVKEAESGEQAIVRLSESNFDLVFCDLRFPTRLTGEQILATIKEQYPHIKVVMMSCAMDAEAQQEFMKKGASAAMQKPFFKNECANMLTNLFPTPRKAA